MLAAVELDDKLAGRNGEVRNMAPDGVLIFFISLNGGRSLRSLAYAPFGAARGRVLRTCGPAPLITGASSLAAQRNREASSLLRHARTCSGHPCFPQAYNRVS